MNRLRPRGSVLCRELRVREVYGLCTACNSWRKMTKLLRVPSNAAGLACLEHVQVETVARAPRVGTGAPQLCHSLQSRAAAPTAMQYWQGKELMPLNLDLQISVRIRNGTTHSLANVLLSYIHVTPM
ncbi:hypothetical protein NDU88_002258 [Pleurodeles waltl]|uniref:Uncharacterized protein n=1 Tax=Pleurodeles waltl TaxID=8319 RepID=A0AAV7LNT1_PLEWA|nr:hypothetical protein NDU88_002258 [Pleurodeles waltl]